MGPPRDRRNRPVSRDDYTANGKRYLVAYANYTSNDANQAVRGDSLYAGTPSG